MVVEAKKNIIVKLQDQRQEKQGPFFCFVLVGGVGEEGWGFSLAELFLSHHRVVLKRHDLETSGLIWLKRIYSRSLKIKKFFFPTLSKPDLNTHHNRK